LALNLKVLFRNKADVLDGKFLIESRGKVAAYLSIYNLSIDTKNYLDYFKPVIYVIFYNNFIF